MGISSAHALGAGILMLSVLSEPTFAFDLNNLTDGCLDDAFCGRGRCVNSRCICDDLWSVNSDFVQIEECVTSLVGIYVLWGLNLLGICWFVYQSTGVIVYRFETFFREKKNRNMRALCQNRALLSVCTYFSLSFPFHLAMTIGHFLDPIMRIGFDLFPTLMFFLTKVGLYLGIYVNQTALFSTMMRTYGKDKLINAHNRYQLFIALCSITVGSFGFVTFSYFQGSLGPQIQILRAYYFGHALSLIINSSGAIVMMRLTNQAFAGAKDIAVNTEKSEEVRRVLVGLQASALKQAGTQGIVYLLMGAVPFFINKHQYFLPISWLSEFLTSLVAGVN